METPASSSRRVRTGLFEIDFVSGDAHKEGRRIPLQDQPLRVLAMLLECPGEVVTREQLQARLWPADTYVGFDEGLNTAIRKLRIAFGDSADSPRFIETLPRRGYRFVAPVHDSTIVTQQPSEAVVPDIVAQQPSVRPSRRTMSVMALAGALLVVLVSVFYLRRPYPSSDSSPPKRVMLAVLPFQYEQRPRASRGELDPRLANAIGYLTGLLLKAHEQGAVEDRLLKI